MRVLHLLKTAVGATWALRQMRQLVELGVDVHVVLPDGPLVPQYRAAGITTHLDQFDLPLRRPQSWPGLFARLRALANSVQPDIIHSHFVGTTLTMRLALGRSHPIPRLFQVPGPLHLEHPFFRRAEIASAGPADSWIGSCRWTCDRYLQSGIVPQRVFLSYYGIDTDSFVPAAPGTLRTELSLTPEQRIVGMVAYMYAPKRYLGQSRGLKGHEDLIDALALVRQQQPGVIGVFIGGAWNNAVGYEQQVRAYAQQRLGDAAMFLGTRHDVAALYADFDVVVHPSHSENVGGAAESLLLAVPTISTNVGGFPDVVIPGETGWLVPPRSPSHLAAAISTALSDGTQAHTLAAQGQRHIRHLFDVRRTAREIHDIYAAMQG
jgi:glycosyltransferase involved in cell wall biosynthesis